MTITKKMYFQETQICDEKNFVTKKNLNCDITFKVKLWQN